jgi:hypothetical protein
VLVVQKEFLSDNRVIGVELFSPQATTNQSDVNAVLVKEETAKRRLYL